MKIVFAVAQNTFKEIIRDRILFALVFFSFFLMVASYFLGQLSFAEQERIVMNMGLTAVNLSCTGLALFLGSTLVSREIEKQTVLTLLSKPISRSQFIFGKYVGLSLVLFLMSFLFSLILFFVTQNYSFFKLQTYLLAYVGTLLEALLILSVALFFGVFCRPILTSFFSFSIWLIGHSLNDLHFFSQKSESPVFKNFGSQFSKYFLNLESFNFREFVIYPGSVDLMQLTQSLVSWFCWSVILIFFSQRIFSKRDFI